MLLNVKELEKIISSVELFEQKNSLINIKNKQIPSLYLFNSTIRNPHRIIEFYNFVNNIIKKFGYDTKIPEKKIFQHIHNLNKKGENGEDNYFLLQSKDHILNSAGLSKKLSELQILGFIKYTRKKNIESNNEYYFTFSQTEYKKNLLESLENIESSYKTEDFKSSFFLFILKKNNLLNFICELIFYLSKKNQFLYVEELSFIYKIFPYLNKKNIVSSEKISNLLHKIRLKHKLCKHINYREYLKKSSDYIEKKNSELTFCKYSTGKEYIDVLLRTLRLSQCFYISNYPGNKIIKFNFPFISKLSYYYYETYDNIKSLLLNGELDNSIKKYEINFLSKINFQIKNPAKERFYLLESQKNNTYHEYDNPEELNNLKEFDNNFALLGWSNFEHMNNSLISYQIKQHFKDLDKKDFVHAIKLDYKGNHLNASTPGVPDFLLKTPNFNIIVESSLRYNYNLRVNEYIQTCTHAEKVYSTDKKTTIVFIVVPRLNKSFINDFKLRTFCNFKLLSDESYTDIIYIPIEYEQYRNIMLRKNSSDYFLNMFESIKKQFLSLNDLNQPITYLDICF